MDKIIFEVTEIKAIYDHAIKATERKWGKTPKELVFTRLLDDIKSFQPSTSNGMVWSKEEKPHLKS